MSFTLIIQNCLRLIWRHFPPRISRIDEPVSMKDDPNEFQQHIHRMICRIESRLIVDLVFKLT